MTVYELAVRLSFNVGGLMAGAHAAMGKMKEFEAAAASTERAFDRTTASVARATTRLANTPSPNFRAYTAAADAQTAAIARQTLAYDAQVAAVARLDAAKAAGGKIGAGVAALGVGMVGLDFVKHAAEAGMKFQITQTLIQQQAHATPQDMAIVNRAIDQAAGHYQMTRQELNETVYGALRMGISGDPQHGISPLQQAAAILPQLAAFQELRKIGAGESPDVSEKSAIALAHIFAQYKNDKSIDGPGIEKMLGYFNGALQITHESSTSFVAALSQIAGGSKSLYGTVNDPKQLDAHIRDMMGVTAIESQLSQQGRGGTQLLNALIKSLPSAVQSHNASLHNPALQRILAASKAEGGPDSFQKDGHIVPIMDFLRIISSAEIYAQKHGDNIALGQTLQQAFGLVGDKNAPLLGDPKTLEQLGRNMQHIMASTTESMINNRNELNATPTGQFTQAHANLEDIASYVGTSRILAGAILGIATAFNVVTGAVSGFLKQHKQVAEFVGVFVLLASTILIIAGTIGIVVGAFALFGVEAAAIGVTVLGIAAGFAAILWPVTLVVLGVASIVAIVMNWSSIMGFLGDHFSFMQPIVSAIGAAFGFIGGHLNTIVPLVLVLATAFLTMGAPVLLVLAAIVGVGYALTHWKETLAFLGKAWNTINDAMSAGIGKIEDIAHKALDWVAQKVLDILGLIAKIPGTQDIKNKGIVNPYTGKQEAVMVDGRLVVNPTQAQIDKARAQADQKANNKKAMENGGEKGGSTANPKPKTATANVVAPNGGHTVAIVNNNHFHGPADPEKVGASVAKQTAMVLKKHLANPVARNLSIHPTPSSIG